ncbi:hypothetical protein [Lysinibacillus odysseyi]|nr:hypothetical protein [Lysinibacillus odysseyi]
MMTVTMRVVKRGKVVEEKIFPGKSIDRVLDYFGKNNIAPDMTKDFEQWVIRSEEGETGYICIDDAEVSVIENITQFEAKYTVDYEEKIEHGLYRLLAD